LNIQRPTLNNVRLRRVNSYNRWSEATPYSMFDVERSMFNVHGFDVGRSEGLGLVQVLGGDAGLQCFVHYLFQGRS